MRKDDALETDGLHRLLDAIAEGTEQIFLAEYAALLSSEVHLRSWTFQGIDHPRQVAEDHVDAAEVA